MVEFKINNYNDRRSLVSILANAGYTVKIREEDRFPHESDMYVQVLDVEESLSVINNITCTCNNADTFLKQINEQLKKNIDRHQSI